MGAGVAADRASRASSLGRRTTGAACRLAAGPRSCGNRACRSSPCRREWPSSQARNGCVMMMTVSIRISVLFTVVCMYPLAEGEGFGLDRVFKSGLILRIPRKTVPLDPHNPIDFSDRPPNCPQAGTGFIRPEATRTPSRQCHTPSRIGDGAFPLKLDGPARSETRRRHPARSIEADRL